jgi:hypothetical protein
MLASIQIDKYPIYRYRLRQTLKEIEEAFGTWPELDKDLRIHIDVALSESPPYTKFVTDPIDKILKTLVHQKQKQERASHRPYKGLPSKRIEAGNQ